MSLTFLVVQQAQGGKTEGKVKSKQRVEGQECGQMKEHVMGASENGERGKTRNRHKKMRIQVEKKWKVYCKISAPSLTKSNMFYI